MEKSMIDKSREKPTLSKLVTLATQRKSREKATLETMIKITEKYGGLTQALTMTDEKDEPDFCKIVEIVTILCQQENPDITEDQVKQNLDMESLGEAMELIREWMNLEVPEAIQRQLEQATQETGNKAESEKDTESKNSRRKTRTK